MYPLCAALSLSLVLSQTHSHAHSHKKKHHQENFNFLVMPYGLFCLGILYGSAKLIVSRALNIMVGVFLFDDARTYALFFPNTLLTPPPTPPP